MVNNLVECKNNIKDALQSRDISVTGGMTTYADLIRQIEGEKYTLDFSLLGYNEEEIKSAYKGINNGIKNGFVLSSDPITLYFPKREDLEKSNANLLYQVNSRMVAVPKFTPQPYQGYMFAGQKILTTIPELDYSEVYNVRQTWGACYRLKNLGGFINMGMPENFNQYTSDDKIYYYKVDFASCPLTRSSIMNVFNNLYDRASAGYPIITLNISGYTYKLLTKDDIAIATNKGWTIVVGGNYNYVEDHV